MSLITYPLDNVEYTADDAALFHATRTTGIHAGDDFSFSVSGSDNTVMLSPGIAWMNISRFKGVVTALKEETAVDAGLPDPISPRIDHIVLQYNANKNNVEIMVKSGTANSSPQPPARSMTAALYEIHVLRLRREPGAVSISARDVTDLRLDKTWCGLMADSVTEVDTEAINAQVTALIAKLEQDLADVKSGTSFVMKSGDTMTGPLSVPAPSAGGHAVNKTYLEAHTVEKSYVDAKAKTAMASLTAAGWSGKTQTVSVTGVTASNTVIVSPAPASFLAYGEAQVRCTAQAAGKLTFTCEDVPAAALTVNVFIYG